MKTYKMAVFASLKTTLEICNSLTLVNNKKIIFMTFDSKENFLFELKISLDIDMIFWEPTEKCNYLFLSQIRQYNKSAKIIILSKLKDNSIHLQDGGNSVYTMNVEQLINLDVLFNQLLSFTNSESDDKVIINGMTLFPMEILFIETYCEHKNCVIVHDDKTKIIRSPLAYFDHLRDYLVRVDRSLIVNLNKIEKIDFQKAVVCFEDSNEVASVSFSNINKLKNLFENFTDFY